MLSIAEKVAFLKETYLLKGVPAKDLEGIAEVAQEIHFTDDQTVFHEGDKGDAIYFIVKGEVKAHNSGVEVVRLEQKKCFGEIAVMDDAPRTTSISPIGDVVLLKIGRDDFHRAVHGSVRLLQNILRIVLRKLREDVRREVQAGHERERMMQDMMRARQMQMSMLPVQDLRIEIANGLALEASGECHPAEMVGGDYHDYFPLSDDQVGLVIGDVMGHGFHTGLMVAMAKSCLHTRIKTDYSLSSVMSALNEMIYGFVQSDLYSEIIFPPFMSFCYIIVDLKDRTFSFSNAGHNFPYHYRANTKQPDMLESNACLLGVMEDQEYETGRSEWAEGDIFVLYSDGIIEALNKDEEEFGDERLRQLIMDNVSLSPVQLKEAILKDVDAFCQGVTQADDITLMVVKMGT